MAACVAYKVAQNRNGYTQIEGLYKFIVQN